MARKTRCAACGRRAWCQWHHVLFEQHGGEAVAENLIPLCLRCHYGYHARSVRIPVAALPDDCLAYAFERLGPYAHDYLLRRYSGEDPRLVVLLDRALEAQELEEG